MNATASPPQSKTPQYRLQVSRYDRASSMLLALVILLGLAVLMLLIVWLTSRIFFSQAAVPVELVELGDDAPVGGGMELEAPIEPLEELQLQDTLAAIADAVATKTAALVDPAVGAGSGVGDGRGVGGGTGVARRWEVRFLEGNTLGSYARQLDFFGMELGVLLPGNKVVYAFNLAKPKPDTRTGPADQEKRYYLTWRGGDLQEADRELLARAGIQTERRIILKFLRPAVEARLAEMEKIHAGPREDEIYRTRFGIRSEAEGYAFFVVDQSYR